MAYGAVHETFWDDPKMRALSESGRHMMLYLFTCRHRNRLGCFVLDPHYAAADLQWNVDRVTDTIGELVNAGRIEYDPDHRVVLIPRYLKHNPLENPNVVKGAIRELGSIPQTPLIGLLLRIVDNENRARYNDLIEALRNRSANGLPNGSGNLPTRDAVPGLTLPEPYHAPPPQRASAGAVPARLREWLGDGLAQAADRFLATNQPASALVGIVGLYLPDGTDHRVWSGSTEADRPMLLATALDRIAAEGQTYRGNFFRAILKGVIDEHIGHGNNGRPASAEARREAPGRRPPAVGNQATRRKQGFGGVESD